jgi:peroxiredoxin (alkyl hydroperoxide reductase subunit C)
MIVGSLAPDFSTNAYSSGVIKNISLQDYRGKWVILFFYSGDFTFV